MVVNRWIKPLKYVAFTVQSVSRSGSLFSCDAPNYLIIKPINQ